MKYGLRFLFIFFIFMSMTSCQMAPSPVYPKEYQDGYEFGEDLAKMDSMECLSSGLFGNHWLIMDLLEKKHLEQLTPKRSEQFMEGFKFSYRYHIQIYYPAYCKD